MEHFETYRAFYDQPIRLTKGQRDEPWEVLSLFFQTYALSDIRQTLGQLLQVALTTDNVAFNKALDRDNTFWFC